MQKPTSRQIMSEKIGRPLHHFEYVHHINGNHEDNCANNLQIVTPREHSLIHGKSTLIHGKSTMKSTRERVKELRRKGLTLREIARIAKVSFQRIDQMFKKPYPSKVRYAKKRSASPAFKAYQHEWYLRKKERDNGGSENVGLY